MNHIDLAGAPCKYVPMVAQFAPAQSYQTTNLTSGIIIGAQVRTEAS